MEGLERMHQHFVLDSEQNQRQLKDFKEHVEMMLLWRDMSVDCKQFREISSKQKS